MKHLATMLFSLIWISGIAQVDEGFMRYYFDLTITKTTDSTQVRKITTVLDVFKDRSFFAEKNFILYQNGLHEANNSIGTKEYVNLLKQAAANYDRPAYLLVKSNANENKVFEKFKNKKFYVIHDKKNLIWDVEDSIYVWNNYKVKKATTQTDGRNWTALFIYDISVHSGPYKFNNLPGFVVKAWDEGEYFVFEYKDRKNVADLNVYLVKPETYDEISFHERKLIKEVYYPDLASTKNDKSRASKIAIDDIQNPIDISFIEQLAYK
ncbi:GLPGLI family protein [Flavobacterium agricola]|uniref:GLPGLI family protein n=1 Tax=Flavobacterium agricola TaxID=2870839 RepID=A0ABY6LW74_9FLAO|nr:GLPGLI family protein [Flavobacterium agricola]UYW00577.1 GLPGLI family protein [Flavobacterium agricola]